MGLPDSHLEVDTLALASVPDALRPGGRVRRPGSLSPQRRAAWARARFPVPLRASPLHTHTVRRVSPRLSSGERAPGLPSAWGRGGRRGEGGGGRCRGRRCSRCGRLGDSESVCMLTRPSSGSRPGLPARQSGPGVTACVLEATSVLRSRVSTPATPLQESCPRRLRGQESRKAALV